MVSSTVTARAKVMGGGGEAGSATLPTALVAPTEAAGGGVGGVALISVSRRVMSALKVSICSSRKSIWANCSANNCR